MTPQPRKEMTVLSRTNLLWIGLSFLVVGQLVAFWMLCSQQVQQAQARVAAFQAQRSDTSGHRSPAVTTSTQNHVAYR